MVKGEYYLNNFTGKIEYEFDGDEVILRAVSKETGKVEFEKQFYTLERILDELIEEKVITHYVASTVRNYIRNKSKFRRSKIWLEKHAICIGRRKYNYSVSEIDKVKEKLIKILPKRYLIK